VATPVPAPVSASALPENTQNQYRNAKHDPFTPDESKNAAAIQCQKKPRRNGATNPAKQHPVTDMGMFFLTKHDIKAIDIFPKDLPTKSVPTSLVRVVSAPGRTAHSATPGMLAN
jgi:hypothetical protein